MTAPILQLPTELYLIILDHLPWRSSIQLAKVCKRWRNVINTTSIHPSKLYGDYANHQKESNKTLYGPASCRYLNDIHIYHFHEVLRPWGGIDYAVRNNLRYTRYNIKIINSVPGKRIVELREYIGCESGEGDGKYEFSGKTLSLNDRRFLDSKFCVVNPDLDNDIIDGLKDQFTISQEILFDNAPNLVEGIDRSYEFEFGKDFSDWTIRRVLNIAIDITEAHMRIYKKKDVHIKDQTFDLACRLISWTKENLQIEFNVKGLLNIDS